MQVMVGFGSDILAFPLEVKKSEVWKSEVWKSR